MYMYMYRKVYFGSASVTACMCVHVQVFPADKLPTLIMVRMSHKTENHRHMTHAYTVISVHLNTYIHYTTGICRITV